MASRSLAAVCVLGILLAGARPASAQMGIIRWLDRLSGPDEFWGYVFEAQLVCYATDANPPRARRLHLSPGCFTMDRSEPRILVGFQAGELDGRNTLDYGPGVIPPDVHAMPLLATIDVGFDERGLFEVGAAVGLVRFYGSTFSFSRFAIEPRVTVKPLVLTTRSAVERRRREWLQVRLSFLGIPQSLDASDFAARGGLAEGSELIGPNVTVVLNFLSLLR